MGAVERFAPALAPAYRAPAVRPLGGGLSVLLGLAALVLCAATAPSGPAVDLFSRFDAALAAGDLVLAADLSARLDGDSAQQRLARGELALATGATEAARADFHGLTDHPQWASRALQGEGLARMQLGDAEAESELKAAVDRDPALKRAWIGLGALADRRRDFAAAEADYAKAIALDPDDAVVWNDRGYSRILQGRFPEAVADLTKAVSLDGKLAAARGNLRLAQAFVGDETAVLADVDAKTLPAALNTLGFAALRRGEWAKAESYFARAQEASPRYDQVIADNLAYARAQQGLK